jgi:UDP-glucose 4-epimerase
VGAINLGTGRGCSLMDVIRVARQVTGRDIATEIRPRRVGDPASAVADSRKAAELLGWIPVYTDIEQSVSHAWNWMSNGASRSTVTASIGKR